MEIRRSFFVALALGLLLPACLYLGAFYMQLGVPTGQNTWMHDIIEPKRRAAEAIQKPKLLIVAGSSALYGISAEEIERQTAMPTVNFGTVIYISPPLMLQQVRKLCRPGDTVLLAFEYELYNAGNLEGDTANELLIHYMLAYDREYVLGMSLDRQIKLALMTPGRRIWAGVQAKFGRVKPEANQDFLRHLSTDMNRHGDYTGGTLDKRPAAAADRETVCAPLTLGLPDSPRGFPAIREFCEWAGGSKISVLATYPNILRRPEYDCPAAERTLRQIADFYTSLRVPLLGTAREAMFPAEQMLDTYYHPLREVAIERTRRLLIHLAPHLKAAR